MMIMEREQTLTVGDLEIEVQDNDLIFHRSEARRDARHAGFMEMRAYTKVLKALDVESEHVIYAMLQDLRDRTVLIWQGNKEPIWDKDAIRLAGLWHECLTEINDTLLIEHRDSKLGEAEVEVLEQIVLHYINRVDILECALEYLDVDGLAKYTGWLPPKTTISAN